jgi:hypothetical protein
MPSPPDDTSVLARWTLDAVAWVAFVRAARPHGSRLQLRDASEAGRTVVVANDAIQVGSERVDLAQFHIHRVVENGTWLQLIELDPDYLPCPLPLPPGDVDLGLRMVEHFRAIAAQHTLESALRSAQAEAERNEPTLSNRILWFVERHFIACLLVFFFVVLPLGSILAAWLV